MIQGSLRKYLRDRMKYQNSGVHLSKQNVGLQKQEQSGRDRVFSRCAGKPQPLTSRGAIFNVKLSRSQSGNMTSNFI